MPEEGIPLSPPSELLSYEEIERLVGILSEMGIKRVRVTGGEPLVRRGIERLIDKIASIEGIQDVSLTTNGVIFHKMAKVLKDAGLKRVNISLDTLKRDRFQWITRRDRLNDVLRSIDVAIELGFYPVKVNTVIIRGFNHDEVLDFGRFAYEKPLTVRFIEYMPAGGEDWGEEKVVPGGEIKRILEKEFELSPFSEDGGGPAETFSLVGGKGRVGFITPISSHFCARCNRLRITPDGKVRPCLFSDVELDIKGPLRSGASDLELRKIFEEAIRLKPRAHKILQGRFRKCQRVMRQIGG